MKYRNCVSFLLAASTLFGAACDKVRTPTEVPASVAPTPAPTPIPQPASLSGKVTKYSGPLAGAPVECQGRSTTTAADGTYSLTGLVSGTATVTVFYNATESEGFGVLLVPGPNTADFFLYE
jgi:hypothetical protein